MTLAEHKVTVVDVIASKTAQMQSQSQRRKEIKRANDGKVWACVLILSTLTVGWYTWNTYCLTLTLTASPRPGPFSPAFVQSVIICGLIWTSTITTFAYAAINHIFMQTLKKDSKAMPSNWLGFFGILKILLLMGIIFMLNYSLVSSESNKTSIEVAKMQFLYPLIFYVVTYGIISVSLALSCICGCVKTCCMELCF